MRATDLVFRLTLALTIFISGCGWTRVDPWHFLIRSESIDSLEKEREILSRAKLYWTDDGRIRVLEVSGTPYERGYQHGALLRREVQDNLNYMYRQSLKTFHSEELFAEAFERARPFIPEEYMEEMHGLAHGARLPLKVIHYIHILPALTEWGGKRRLKEIVKKMMDGELATSCSNIGAFGDATQDGEMYVVRVLDWGLHKISKLHQYPLIAINRPSKGYASANIGWVGFLGAISGMNERGITLGEMGYGAPPNERLSGRPMPFLLRDVLTYADNLTQVRKLIKESPGENSYIFLMSDGKRQEVELYVKDAERFIIGKPNSRLVDGEEDLPAIKDTVYGGHFAPLMAETLQKQSGHITPNLLMESIIPAIAMKSNFQNVVYDPKNLKFWVANALGKDHRAAEQPYTYFDLGAALRGGSRAN